MVIGNNTSTELCLTERGSRLLRKKTVESSTFIFVPSDFSLSLRLHIQQPQAWAICLSLFQLIPFEVWHTINFNTLSPMDWNHMCTHPVDTLHTYSTRSCLRVPTHTCLASVTRKAMSTYLKYTDNSNKPVRGVNTAVWVTTTLIRISSLLKQPISKSNALEWRAALNDTCAFKAFSQTSALSTSSPHFHIMHLL